MVKDKEMNKTTKRKEVLNHLQRHGSITSIEAIQLFGATRLSSIIYDLRKYNNIDGVKVQGRDRYGNTVYYTKYYYKGEEGDPVGC